MASYFEAAKEMLPNGTKYVVVGAAVGAVAISLAGVAAGAAVPCAMSTFGTIVPGVGTMHAAGGVAATLQWTSTAFTGGAAWYGAGAGAAAAATAAAAVPQTGDDAGCTCKRKCTCSERKQDDENQEGEDEDTVSDGGANQSDDSLLLNSQCKCQQTNSASGDNE